MSKATPRPWTALEGKYPDRWGTSNAASDNCCIYTQADAELIVRAVNMHDELLALLEWAKSAYWARCYEGKSNERVYTLAEFDAHIDALLAKARGSGAT